MGNAWSAQRNGDWSVTSDNGVSPWHDGGAQTARASIPQDTDTVDLAGFVVDMDAGATTIPPSGSLASLSSPATAGQLTIDLNAIGDADLNADEITAGTVVGGTIAVTGAAPAATLTITGNVTGGGNGCQGVNTSSTGSVDVVGNVTGGSAGTGYGVYASAGAGDVSITGDITTNGATVGARYSASNAFDIVGDIRGGAGTNLFGCEINSGTVTVNGDITGGTGQNTTGMYVPGGTVTITGDVYGGTGNYAAGLSVVLTGAVTLSDSNLIDGSGGVAYSGKPPTWTPAATNYHQLSGGTKMAPEVAAADLELGVQNGTVTGTFTAPAAGDVQESVQYGGGGTEFTGTFAVPTAGEVKDGVQYGANATEFTGTCVVPLVADVQSGVAYGAGGSEFTGTFTEPGVENVESGVQYGGGGTEFTGTFVVPAVGDVQSAVTYGDSAEFTGTFTSPPLNKVKNDTSWGAGGTEFTGTLDVEADNPDDSDVRMGVANGGSTGTLVVPRRRL